MPSIYIFGSLKLSDVVLFSAMIFLLHDNSEVVGWGLDY
jgi:hypothetical protein